MGITGAGKSIQGQLLADQLGIPWVSTGELLRTDLHDEGNPQMLAGKLYEDQQIITLLDQKLQTIPNGDCVMDGFPRTKVQADWLIAQVKAGRLKIRAIIHLKVSESVVMLRLHARGRPDDTEEAIRQRFNVYQTYTMPLVTDLREAGLTVLDINGEQPIEAVHDTIVRTLGI